jgi:NADH:ubiquinone oxidoreductase subunit H
MWTTVREFISLLGDIGGTQALLTGVAVLAAPLLRAAWRRVSAWRDQRSRRGLINQIAQLERLSTSPSARTELMQKRVFWIFAVLGAWIMFMAIGQLPDTQTFMLFNHLVSGALIYMIAVSTAGEMMRLKKASETLERLRKKLDKLPPSQ